MRYTIEYTVSAARELQALPVGIRERIATRITALADTPFPPGVKKLRGEPAHFRIRVGDYRVIYRLDGGRLVVVIVRIGHRREVYR